LVSKTFSTADDGQPQIRIRLSRGDSSSIAAAHPLGTFQISGFAPAPRGIPSILVKFVADSSGISLRATDNLSASGLVLTRVAP
jgi:molecular chaperone DnaK